MVNWEHLLSIGNSHGIVMFTAFAILFPLGACLLRAFRGSKVTTIHAIWQIISWALAVAGFGMGLYVSKNGGYGTFKAPNGHKIIGLIVIILMTIQPFLGVVHHLLFRKHERTTAYGLVHRFIGRIAIIMGGINVGLGLQLAKASLDRTVGYVVVMAFCFGTYIAVTALLGPEAQKCRLVVDGARRESGSGSEGTRFEIVEGGDAGKGDGTTQVQNT